MAAPTSTNEVTARKFSSSISALWTKIKSTFQTLGNLVTTWGSTPSDTHYPSEKLVKDSLDGKAPNAPSEVTIANGDKIIIADSSDSNKVKRASVAFDGSTTKNFLSKKGTFEEVKESEVAWGGDFHADLSPIEMGMFPQNLIANPPPENIKYEQTTDGGETWSVVSLTDSQKKQFCNLTSGVTLPAGPTTTDDNVLPLQRGRVTIALLPFGATEYSDTWCYGQVKRILLYINRSSSPEVAHCVVEVQTGPHFIANDGVWTTLGDYNVTGDGGWNSIPIGDILGGYSSQLSGRRVAIRFTYWVTKKPTSGSGGRISLYSLGILPGTVWKSNANAVAKQKLPVQVENDGTGTVQKSRSLATARKLKTNLARTADSTFDGSADQTNIPVTGTLPVGNGGTGKASVTANSYLKGNGTGALVECTYAQVRTDLGLGSVYSKDVPSSGNASTSQVVMGNDTRLSDARTPTAHTHTADAADVVDSSGDSAITDSTDIITTHVNGYSSTNKKLYRRNFKDYVWPWIKDKISSVLGLSTTGYTGNAATATKATKDSDGNAINATYFKSSGNTTLVAGAATKIGTQNGADVKLTLPAHQDISGKMDTSASNATAPSSSGGDGATATLLNNLSDGTSDIVTTDNGDNVLIVTTDNGGSVTNKWYKRKLVKLIPWIIKKLGSRLVYDCGAGSTSGDDFDAALAAFNAGQWVIIHKDNYVYYCVGTFQSSLRFRKLSNSATGISVSTLNWTSGSEPTSLTQLDASLSGHTHTRSDITNFAHTHGNIQDSGALQTSDVTIASGDKLVVTDSSDSGKVARASASFDGSTTTKALTQKGTFETFMTPSAGNAASGALQNLTGQLTEGTSDFTDNTEIFTSYAGNNGFAESGHVNQPYRRKASSMLNYVRDEYAINRSPASVGTSHKRISLGYGKYNSSAVGAATYLVHLFFNYVDDGGLVGKGITVLVTYDFRFSSLQKSECRILSDNGVRDAGYNVVLANFISDSGDNGKLHICIGLVKNSAPTTLVAFNYSYCKIFKVSTIGDWTQDISSDAVGTYDYIVQATDLVSSAVNADMVDGKHIVIGSWAGASNTIYFG